MTVRHGAVTFDWLGDSCVRLEGRTGAVIYVDPQRDVLPEAGEPGDGDLIMITHGHHYDPDAIDAVAQSEAFVVVHEAVGGTTNGRPEELPYEVERVRADESFVLGPLDLFTTPAYNEPDGANARDDGTVPHPDGSGCGYVVTIDGVRAFWPGDTDALESHEELDVDLLFPPVGGEATMGPDAAATLAERMEPALVCPIRYRRTERLETALEGFVLDVATSGVPVVLDAHRGVADETQR